MAGSIFKKTLSFLIIFISSSIVAQTGGDAIIYPNKKVGKQIDHFYYDVKNGGATVHNTTKANDLYVSDDMNGIRIPIYGNEKNPAHPSAGVVVESEYASIIKSVNFASDARGDKDFYIFASKKLNGQDSYPDWTHNDNGIIVGEYVKLLTDFILFFKEKGIEIDYLGAQNEGDYTEAQLSPKEHKDIVDSLRVISEREGFKMPLIVGYEMYGPNKFNWTQNLQNNGWLDRMDVYGTHYYPQYRPLSNLTKELNRIGNIPFWSTEPHWDSKADVDDWDEAEAGICAFWDQIDVGMSGFMWWAYSRSGGIRGNLMREFSVPLLGATMIDMNDIDGRGTATYGKLQTRAFREDSLITVYAVNNNAGKTYNNYGFQLNEGYISDKVSYKQFTKGSNTATGNGNATRVTNQKFSLTLPAHSITIFSFILSDTPTSAKETVLNRTPEIYPTVASDVIHIRSLQTGAAYNIYDLNGKLLESSTENHVNISNFNSGIYLIKFNEGGVRKFVKK